MQIHGFCDHCKNIYSTKPKQQMNTVVKQTLQPNIFTSGEGTVPHTTIQH